MGQLPELPCEKEANCLKRGGVEMAISLTLAVFSWEFQSSINQKIGSLQCSRGPQFSMCLEDPGGCSTEQMALSWCIVKALRL